MDGLSPSAVTGETILITAHFWQNAMAANGIVAAYSFSFRAFWN
jgi:hypothetical protein